ncbi:hypothetical protein CJU89_0349 [Yarrowia sp. B02]|nr:hypothetical protein CJU89_0349 [Yarrowia sp. B02]
MINFSVETGPQNVVCVTSSSGTTTYSLPSDFQLLIHILHKDRSAPDEYHLYKKGNPSQPQHHGEHTVQTESVAMRLRYSQ